MIRLKDKRLPIFWDAFAIVANMNCYEVIGNGRRNLHIRTTISPGVRQEIPDNLSNSHRVGPDVNCVHVDTEGLELAHERIRGRLDLGFDADKNRHDGNGANLGSSPDHQVFHNAGDFLGLFGYQLHDPGHLFFLAVQGTGVEQLGETEDGRQWGS
jgi:hypothetical protein